MNEEDLKQFGITELEFDRILEKTAIKFNCSVEDIKKSIYISAAVFAVIEEVSEHKIRQN